MVFVLGARVIMGLCAIKWCNSLMANIVKSTKCTTVENIGYALGDSKIDISLTSWKGNRLLGVFFFDLCPQNHGHRRNIHSWRHQIVFFQDTFTLKSLHRLQKNNRNTGQWLQCNIQSNQTSWTLPDADTCLFCGQVSVKCCHNDSVEENQCNKSVVALHLQLFKWKTS